ncbi:MAG: hypothetical protein P9X27_04480 [Candidatus Kaelpia aquatica]|nr:hypothetical protein [Candidatus Kaelpia aquatica]
MKCNKLSVVLVCFILIGSVVFIPGHAYARRIKDDSSELSTEDLIRISNAVDYFIEQDSMRVEMSTENREKYIDYLQKCNLQTSERNIQLFARLNKSSVDAGFNLEHNAPSYPGNTFDVLKSLTETGIVTEDNLPQLINLGITSAEAGFHPWHTFRALEFLAKTGILIETNLP